MKPIVIVGAGGYAQELAWILEDQNAIKPTWECLGYVDPANPQRRGERLYDLPILGGMDEVSTPGDLWFACGIGDPWARAKESAAAESRGWRAATLVHPSVIRARHVEVGEGTIIGAGSILSPYARIGRQCAINLHVTVGHDSVVGDYCVLSPGTRISGGAILESHVFIGTNATVFLKRRVGAGSSLGANSFLVTNLAKGKSAIGTPAKVFGQATGAGICSNMERRSSSSEGRE